MDFCGNVSVLTKLLLGKVSKMNDDISRQKQKRKNTENSKQIEVVGGQQVTPLGYGDTMAQFSALPNSY